MATANKMLVLSLFFFMVVSCTLEKRISNKLPERSQIDSKCATTAINQLMGRMKLNQPFKLRSIELRRDTTVINIGKGESEFSIYFDTKCKVIYWYELLRVN